MKKVTSQIDISVFQTTKTGKRGCQMCYFYLKNLQALKIIITFATESKDSFLNITYTLPI